MISISGRVTEMDSLQEGNINYRQDEGPKRGREPGSNKSDQQVLAGQRPHLP